MEEALEMENLKNPPFVGKDMQHCERFAFGPSKTSHLPVKHRDFAPFLSPDEVGMSERVPSG
jgi:hypothetical protein